MPVTDRRGRQAPSDNQTPAHSCRPVHTQCVQVGIQKAGADPEEMSEGFTPEPSGARPVARRVWGMPPQENFENWCL